MKTGRHIDAHTPRDGGRLVGDDLTDAELDALHAVLVGDAVVTDAERAAAGWWEDKPHQVAYRLLCRLTRAESRGA